MADSESRGEKRRRDSDGKRLTADGQVIPKYKKRRKEDVPPEEWFKCGHDNCDLTFIIQFSARRHECNIHMHKQHIRDCLETCEMCQRNVVTGHWEDVTLTTSFDGVNLSSDAGQEAVVRALGLSETETSLKFLHLGGSRFVFTPPFDIPFVCRHANCTFSASRRIVREVHEVDAHAHEDHVTSTFRDCVACQNLVRVGDWDASEIPEGENGMPKVTVDTGSVRYSELSEPGGKGSAKRSSAVGTSTPRNTAKGSMSIPYSPALSGEVATAVVITTPTTTTSTSTAGVDGVAGGSGDAAVETLVVNVGRVLAYTRPLLPPTAPADKVHEERVQIAATTQREMARRRPPPMLAGVEWSNVW